MRWVPPAHSCPATGGLPGAAAAGPRFTPERHPNPVQREAHHSHPAAPLSCDMLSTSRPLPAPELTTDPPTPECAVGAQRPPAAPAMSIIPASRRLPVTSRSAGVRAPRVTPPLPPCPRDPIVDRAVGRPPARPSLHTLSGPRRGRTTCGLAGRAKLRGGGQRTALRRGRVSSQAQPGWGAADDRP
jgi:hypothetical protein